MSTVSEFLEDILEKCGGLGRFQWLLLASILGGKITITWTTLMMSFAGAIPEWSCKWGNETDIYENITTKPKTCSPPKNFTELGCVKRVYDIEMNTVVSEWDLVCDREWITQTMTTIQMGGVLVGGLVAGQLADLIGRKPTYIISIFLLFIFDLVAAFSVNWQMFATVRFFIGLASGFYFSIFYVFIAEFMPSKYRPIILAIPLWPVYAAAFGGVSYLIHNWKYLHIATACSAIPFILTLWILPESFRWLVANGKVNEAEEVITKIARINKTQVPDTSKLRYLVENSVSDENKKYTYFDVLRNKERLKKTVLLAVCWISMGYGYYAIAFGIQQLSGSLYLNMFLLSIVLIPSDVITYPLINYIGRKWTMFLFLVLAAVSGTIVGAVQRTELVMKDSLINGFAMATKLFLGSAWCALKLLTAESYATVVRNMGYAVQSSVAGIGSMVAPQIVYLSRQTEGLLYFLLGALMFMSAVCTLCLPDTSKQALVDTIDDYQHNRQQDTAMKEKKINNHL